MKIKVKFSEALYLTCYVLFIILIYIFGEIYNKPRIMWLVFPVLSVGMLLAVIMKGKETARNLWYRLIIVMIYWVAAIISKKPQVLVYAALICGADITSFEKICRCCIFTCVTVVVITMLLNALGFLPNGHWYRFGVQINTFGFGYYAIVPYTFFYIVLSYLFLKYEKGKIATWGEIGIILAINYLIYTQTTVRLTYYLNYLTILLYVLLIKIGLFKLTNKVLNFLTILIFPSLFIFSIWANYSFTYSNPMFFRVNMILSNRLALGNEALRRYSINLFGNYIVTNNSVIAEEYFYIDSGFLFSLLGYGLLFTGLMLAVYIYMHHYSAKTNNKMLFIWLTMVAVFSFSNNTWIAIQYNPITLLFPTVIKQMRPQMHINSNAKSLIKKS